MDSRDYYNTESETFGIECYASFTGRVGASIADGIILLIYLIIIYLPISLWAANTDSNGPIILLILLAVVPIALYEIFFVASEWQATPGRMLAGIEVTNLEGKRISYMQSFWRFLARWIFGYIPLINIISPLMVIFDEQNQTFHDMIAGTLVLNSGARDLFVDMENASRKVVHAPPRPAPPPPALGPEQAELQKTIVEDLPKIEALFRDNSTKIDQTVSKYYVQCLRAVYKHRDWDWPEEESLISDLIARDATIGQFVQRVVQTEDQNDRLIALRRLQFIALQAFKTNKISG